MLARLQLIEGVTAAGVDYGGNHLRLRVEGPAALDASCVVLRDLGYAPEVVVAAEGPAPDKWYDVTSVSELSAVEASVIARRVVEKFDRTNALEPAIAQRLQHAVSTALQSCFADRDLTSHARHAQFQSDCLRLAREAARGVLGATDVEAFVETLEADLNEDHTHDAGL